MADIGKPKPNFLADLKFGQAAEAKLLEKYGELLEALDGKTGDFLIKNTNLKIEYKVDRYDANKWPNLILERYRSGTKNGGPFQALDHECRYFLYYFEKNDLLFFYDTYQLCRRITMLVKKHKFPLETISNGSYNTSYYRIPRNLLADIALPFFETIKRKYDLVQKRKVVK